METLKNDGLSTIEVKMINTDYIKLKNKVYEIIYPKGIPLEPGCLIELTDGFTGFYTGKSIAGNWILYSEFISGIRTVKPQKKAKLLGQVLSLQDFLTAWGVAHSAKKHGDDLAVYDIVNGVVSILDAPFQTIPEIKIQIALLRKKNSTPLLSDQPSETLRRLYKLIN